MIKDGFYNSKNRDRLYSAEDMSNYFKGLFSKGIIMNYKDEFKVKASDPISMQIIIGPGRAFFKDGKYIENTSPFIIEVPQAPQAGIYRKDRVILESNNEETSRQATIKYVIGEPGDINVEAKPLINNDKIQQLSLATLLINPEMASIPQAIIEDTRPDQELCGFVKGLIEEVKSKDLFEQYNAIFNEWFEDAKNSFKQYFTVTLLKENMTTLGDNIKNIPILIKNFNDTTDTLNIYLNGIKLNQDEYTISDDKKNVILRTAIHGYQEIEEEVFKPIDTQKANDIVDELMKTQQEVGILRENDELLDGKINNLSNRVSVIESGKRDTGWIDIRNEEIPGYEFETEYPARIRMINDQVFLEGVIEAKHTLTKGTVIFTIHRTANDFKPKFDHFNGDITVSRSGQIIVNKNIDRHTLINLNMNYFNN